ncbi:hypothetical protein ABK040_007467 [Willaertia magna]
MVLIGFKKVPSAIYDFLWILAEGCLTMIALPFIFTFALLCYIYYFFIKRKEYKSQEPYQQFNHILITGTSSGIGKGLAVELCKRRNQLIRKYNKITEKVSLIDNIENKFILTLVGRNVEAMKEVKKECEEILSGDENYEILIREADVTDKEKIKTIVEEYDYDLVIANAGVSLYQLKGGKKDINKLDNFKLQQKVWETNLTGCTNTIFPSATKMINDSLNGNKKRRHIVLISSGTAYIPEISGIYGITKSTLLQLGKSLRFSFKNSNDCSNIRVNVVTPGWVKSKMADAFPDENLKQGMLSAEDAAMYICDGIERDYEIIDLTGLFGIVMRSVLWHSFPYTLSSAMAGLFSLD